MPTPLLVTTSQRRLCKRAVERFLYALGPIHHHHRAISSALEILLFLGSRHLSRGHGFGYQPFQGKLLLLQVVGGAFVELQCSHCVTDRVLNLLLLAALQLEGQGGVGDNLFDTANV